MRASKGAGVVANPEHFARIEQGAERWHAWVRTRRDADALFAADLREADLRGAKRRRGILRVFPEAAPGVGKPSAMLNEGKRLRADGRDVVAGFIEPGCGVRRDQPNSSAPRA